MKNKKRKAVIINKFILSLEAACFPDGKNEITKEQMKDFISSGLAMASDITIHCITQITNLTDDETIKERIIEEICNIMKIAIRKELG